MTDVPENVSTFDNDAGYLTEASLGNILDSLYHLIDSLISSSPHSNLPTLNTNDITDLYDNEATSGGEIFSVGSCNVIARGLCWSTHSSPTITDMVSNNGTGWGSFSHRLTGLQPSTTYYVRAYATTCEGTAYGNQVVFTTPAFVCGTSQMHDIQNHLYATVQIGSQCWIKSNLCTSQYDDGTSCSYSVPTVGNNYEHYYSGFYYVGCGSRNVCPSNWHVPSASEWLELIDYANGHYSCGAKALCTGFQGPSSCSQCSISSSGTNSTGLGLSPTYYRSTDYLYTATYVGRCEDNSVPYIQLSSQVNAHLGCGPEYIGISYGGGIQGAIRCVRD